MVGESEIIDLWFLSSSKWEIERISEALVDGCVMERSNEGEEGLLGECEVEEGEVGEPLLGGITNLATFGAENGGKVGECDAARVGDRRGGNGCV